MDRPGAFLLQGSSGKSEGGARVNHVIEEDRNLVQHYIIPQVVKENCTHFVFYIANENFDSFWSSLRFALTLPMSKGKFNSEFICHCRCTVAYLGPVIYRTQTSAKITHRLAPPASGLTTMPFAHPGILCLMYETIDGSDHRLSTGMSKKP